MSNILGNTLNSVTTNVRGSLASVGRAALHTMAPDNIEYYLCSLELLDSVGTTKGFLSFNIMPNSIMESKTQIASITKTNAGIVTMFNSTFQPRQISIQGTFGRKLRVITGALEVANKSGAQYKNTKGENLRSSLASGDTGFYLPYPMSPSYDKLLFKTGYGLTKMLQSICNASWSLDENNKPYILIFTNYALNTSYVVEVLQDSYSQSVDNNMLWYYSLELKAVAPSSIIKSSNHDETTKLLSSVAANAISKGLTNVISDVVKYSSQGLSSSIDSAKNKISKLL